MSENNKPRRKNIVRRFFSVLGPGLITGAADDDPWCRHLHHRRCAARHFVVVDGVPYLAAHGLRAIHVCPHRDGYGARTRRSAAAEGSAVVVDYRSDSGFRG